MKRLKTLNLKQRMGFGFAIVFMIVVLSLSFGIAGLTNSNAELERSVRISKESRLANDIKQELLASNLAFKAYLSAEDTEANSIGEFEREYNSLRGSIRESKSITIDQERYQLVSQIEDEVVLVNDNFNKVLILNVDLKELYNRASDAGYRMLDNLQELKTFMYDNGDAEMFNIISSAREDLLIARLHATKFFDFHTEYEYGKYIEVFERYRKIIEGIPYTKNISQVYPEYIRLVDDIDVYAMTLEDLHTKIVELDRLVDEIDEVTPKVEKYSTSIVQSIESELLNAQESATETNLSFRWIMVGLTVFSIAMSLFVISRTLHLVIGPVNYLKQAFDELSEDEANAGFRLDVKTDDEIGEMALSFNTFMVQLNDVLDRVTLSNYIQTATNEMSELVRDEIDMTILAERLLTYVCNYTDGVIGSFFVYNSEDEVFNCIGTYGHALKEGSQYDYSEGLVGQIALNYEVRILDSLEIKDFDKGRLLVRSGTMEKEAASVAYIPTLFEGDVNGLLEVGFFSNISNRDTKLFKALGKSIGSLIHIVDTRNKMKQLLDRTIKQTEELQLQQEELRQSNEELEEQTRALKESELRLQAQQEELRVSNEELGERSKQLELQKNDLNIKNAEILASREEILKKAEELEVVNRYKSEFLANMSHELRTPLNSILVLSQLLEKRNENTPMSEKERSFAGTIYRSGRDLLTMINGVLDLAKVEAGRLELTIEKVILKQLISENKEMFEPIVEKKGIQFIVDNQIEDIKEIKGDYMRINQIVKNLLSNAVKFTEEGYVKLRLRKPDQSEMNRYECNYEDCIVFEVEDTGIGIAKDKQETIFEAFKQSDGSTSRNYGGTGLGLTIAQQLAHLMKGELYLDSDLGKGSRFVFIVSKNLENVYIDNVELSVIHEVDEPVGEPVDKESKEIILEKTEDKPKEVIKLLIVEGNVKFSGVLKELAESKDYLVYLVHSGYEAITEAKKLHPNGILLDTGLPDMDGMELVERLGAIEETKNIPIHIISESEDGFDSGIPKSIIGFLKKPVDIKAIYQTMSKIEAYIHKGLKKLLVVGACGNEGFEFFETLGAIEVVKVKNGEEAISLLEEKEFGCIVMDSKLEGMSGIEFVKHINNRTDGKIPIIIYTEKEMATDELDSMEALADSVILKTSKSKKRLIDEVNLFLHDVKEQLAQYSEKTNVSKEVVQANVKEKIRSEDTLEGIKVLVVDDDERNIFALTHALEQYGMTVEIAENGIQGIEMYRLKKPDIVLMDIMMPEMDGYEAIGEIKKLQTKGHFVPIIALTAKAMKDDREKCIEAGADDYMTKPIDVEKLISTIKVWLS